MLLADRVTGIAAAPGSMGTGTIWTETDVVDGAWYLDPAGRMPAGIISEAGQADLLLISWLGVDLLTKGERIYRLLGCEITYHGSLPEPGNTLRYQITIDGHGEHDGIRLFFFHYDCYVGDELKLTGPEWSGGLLHRRRTRQHRRRDLSNRHSPPTSSLPHPRPAGTRTPKPSQIHLFDKVSDLREGYVKTELSIHEDDWFFDGHFKNDRACRGP